MNTMPECVTALIESKEMQRTFAEELFGRSFGMVLDWNPKSGILDSGGIGHRNNEYTTRLDVDLGPPNQLSDSEKRKLILDAIRGLAVSMRHDICQLMTQNANKDFYATNIDFGVTTQENEGIDPHPTGIDGFEEKYVQVVIRAPLDRQLRIVSMTARIYGYWR